MTIMRCLAALCMAMVPALAPAAGAAALESLKLRPMSFSVVKGEPNACGPGCAEWIAAQGDFDAKVANRFRDLLDKLPNSHLPVFFNSRGGQIGPALSVGELLRLHAMRAGIGRTISNSGNSGGKRQYRIEYRNSICASACAYAFIGATSREVAPAARLGVHNGRAAGSTNPAGDRLDKLDDTLRIYAISKGIDPALIDLAASIPTTHMYWLTRSTMMHYGIVSNEPFETPWRLFTNRGKFLVVKSLTRGAGVKRQTTLVEFACGVPGVVRISIRRELTEREIGSRSVLRLKSDDPAVWNSDAMFHELSGVRKSNGRYDRREKSIPFDSLLKIATGKALQLEEVFSKPGYNSWMRAATLSTKGLHDKLMQMEVGCGDASLKLLNIDSQHSGAPSSRSGAASIT